MKIFKTSLKISPKFISRCLSSQGLSVAKSLPPNLRLADPKILLPPEPPIIPDERYFFSILSTDVPDVVPVYSFENPGTVLSNIPLNKKIFAVALRKDIVLEIVRYQRNNKRQPQRSKRIRDIAGSNKKPYPQKGTGRAQVGNKRNSVWRKGQKAHGPVLRAYTMYTPRKQRALGMMISLAAKLKEGNLVIFDKLSCTTQKTKLLANILSQHGLLDHRTLFLDDVIHI